MVLPIIHDLLKKKVTWKTHAFSTRLLKIRALVDFEGVKRAYEAGYDGCADG